MGQSGRRVGSPGPPGPDAADPTESRPSLEASAAGPLADMIRRLAAVGLSGFFATEGAVRKAFGDTVPQDWVDFVSDQSERGRQELFDRLAAEVGRVLEDTDVEELLENLLTGRTIEVEAKVRIGPRSESGSADRDASGDARTTRRKRRTD